MRISDWSSDVCSSDLALDARETVEARGDLVVGNAHVQRHRDRSERVLHIVASRHRQVDARNRAAIAIAVAHHDAEAVTVGEIGRASCRERVCPYVSIWVVTENLKKNLITTHHT